MNESLHTSIRRSRKIEYGTYALHDNAAQTMRYEDDRAFRRLTLVSQAAPTPVTRYSSYIRQVPLHAQIGYERPRMVVEVLAGDLGAGMGVGVVAPTEDAGVWDVLRQEITEPVDAVARGPGLVAVAVEAMDGDDTTRGK